MIDIEKIKPEIIENLKSLEPDKIVLFGSYAYGKPDEDSDIDLFIFKDGLDAKRLRDYRIDARLKLRQLVSKYKIGFDILSGPFTDSNKRKDYFYKVDIVQKGRIIYERSRS